MNTTTRRALLGILPAAVAAKIALTVEPALADSNVPKTINATVTNVEHYQENIIGVPDSANVTFTPDAGQDNYKSWTEEWYSPSAWDFQIGQRYSITYTKTADAPSTRSVPTASPNHGKRRNKKQK